MIDKRNKIKILHLAPHFAGGVGRVVFNYLEKVKNNSSFSHQLIGLDYTRDKIAVSSKMTNFSFRENMASNYAEILSAIADADITLIHWWNHPLIYDFLVRVKLPPCRLVIWSHISGFHSPMVFTDKLIRYPDFFVFTTPVSFETKEIKKLSDKQKKSLRVVWSTGGVERFKSIKPKKHSGFNVGYIGTVDYVKMHPNFLDICNKINIPDAKFVVCGGPSDKEIKKEAKKLGIAEKFDFTGLVPDVAKQLSAFDIFGYPLNPRHYGSCDQSLQESMAAGVVPVVLENRMEKYMVKNGVTGIVAKNEYDYILAVLKLYKNKTLRGVLSRNAREYAIKTFSLNRLAKDWEIIFDELLANPKTPKKWQIAKSGRDITAKDVFLESLGDYGKAFTSYCESKSKGEKNRAMQETIKLNKSTAWRAKTRGTVHHYHSVFLNDKILAMWSRLMRNTDSKN